MTPEQLTQIQRVIRETIEVKVNGRIEALHEKVDAHNEKHEEDMQEVRKHMEAVQPYIDGARGVKVITDFGKWFVGLGVIWLAIKGIFVK